MATTVRQRKQDKEEKKEKKETVTATGASGAANGSDSPSLDPSSSLLTPSVTATTTADSAASAQPVVNDKERKKQAIYVRTLWTFIMLLSFFALIGMGPFWVVLLVMLLQVLVFKECISITTKKAQNVDLKHTTYLNWYFLVTTIFYLEGKSIIKYSLNYLIDSEYTSAIAIRVVMHHKFICYCMYVLGFVGFVASLKKGYLKYQFAQLAATHMILVMVILQGHCIVNNIMHGIFWFLLPVGLVITNDIFAYICGITFGKTQLISISPKKTVEGFVGAWICTTFMSVLLTYVLCNRAYFICPFANDLSVNCLSDVQCDPNPVFIHQVYRLPDYLSKLLGKNYIQLKPIYLHSIALSMFASLIAPFGGFFASGLKRAFGIKDFGDTIPGHGGVTDRMDCQFMMGSFSYLYYETFINVHTLTVGNLLQTVVINLSGDEILQLVKSLVSYLHKVGVLDEEHYGQVGEALGVH